MTTNLPDNIELVLKAVNLGKYDLIQSKSTPVDYYIAKTLSEGLDHVCIFERESDMFKNDALPEKIYHKQSEVIKYAPPKDEKSSPVEYKILRYSTKV